MKIKSVQLAILSSASLMLVATGCTTSASSLISQVTEKVEAPKQQPSNVTRVLCLWQPGEGPDVDGGETRGFAGKIMFFEGGNQVPVPVKGQVEIYEFDNIGTPKEQAVPVHKFTFKPEAWSKYRAESKSIGSTYTIFIPYMRKHTYGAKVALKVVFKPEGGQQISSQFNTVVLEGEPHPKAHVDPSFARKRGSMKDHAADFLQLAANSKNREESLKQVVTAETNDGLRTIDIKGAAKPEQEVNTASDDERIRAAISRFKAETSVVPAKADRSETKRRFSLRSVEEVPAETNDVLSAGDFAPLGE